MRLPGTRYQEHGWEQVRKLLGQCSLQVFDPCAAAMQAGVDDHATSLSLYVDLMAESLRASTRLARGQAPGNSYGDSVAELAVSLVWTRPELEAGVSWLSSLLGAQFAQGRAAL